MNYCKTYFLRTVFFVSLFVSMFSSLLFAGNEGHNIAGISMARSFVASARGLEAIGTNPANLTLPYKGGVFEFEHTTVTHDSLVEDIDSTDHLITTTVSVTHDTVIITRQYPPTVTFTLLPSFSFGARTDFINYDIYNEYFTGIDADGDGVRESRHLTDEEKGKVLELFPSGLAETHFNFDLRLFGLTFHNDYLGEIGLSITDHAAFNFDMPKDYLRPYLDGFDSLGTSYDLSGTNIRAWYYREYALTYARSLPMVTFVKDFCAGVSVKVIHGYAVVITDKYNATFGTHAVPNSVPTFDGNFDFRILRSQSDNFPQFHSTVGNIEQEKSSFSPFPSPAGTGLGFDLGVSGEVINGIRVAASVTDIGSINWTANTMQTVGDKSIHMTNLTGQSQTDTLSAAFNGRDTTTDAFSTALPTSMRIGTSVHVDELIWWPGHMMISVEYQQGFNNSPGNTKRPRLAVGAEWRLIPFLPMRTGVSFGGADRFNWAAGFGLDFGGFAWNFGTENIALIATPHSYQQLSFGMSTMIRI